MNAELLPTAMTTVNARRFTSVKMYLLLFRRVHINPSDITVKTVISSTTKASVKSNSLLISACYQKKS